MTEKRRSDLLKQWPNRPRIVADMEIKAADDGSRTFEGALSTSHLDLGDGWRRDIVMPGAFKRWLKSFRSANNPYVPLLDSHDRWSIFNVLGHLLDGEERLTGKTLKYELQSGKTLEVEEMYFDSTWQVIDGQDGDRLLDRMRPGSVRKMSMGYRPHGRSEDTLATGETVRLLKEVSLEEGSLVVFPMNPEADVNLDTVKGFLDDLDPDRMTDEDRASLEALQKEIGSLLKGGDAQPPGPEPEAIEDLVKRIRRLNLHRLVTRIEAARHSGESVLNP